MSQYVNLDDRQLSLDFNPPTTTTLVGQNDVGSANVVSLNVYAKSCLVTVQTSPVLERLLQEAQKLRW